MRVNRQHTTTLRRVLLMLMLMSAVTSCKGRQNSTITTKQSRGVSSLTATISDPTTPYVPPTIPKVLTTTEERAAYLVAHYWDDFRFADTMLISHPEITEQAEAWLAQYCPCAQTAISPETMK